MNKKRNATAMRDLLRKRYNAPAWALLFEVTPGTGANATRWADAVAMSLWPSRGLEINGIEVKVSRSDWLRELKDPAKSEAVQSYCDRWWVVVSDDTIVKDGELPPTWGLLVARGQALHAKVQAPKLDPKPLDVDFVAALLRRSSESTEALCKEERAAGRAEVAEEVERGHESGAVNERVAGELTILRETVKSFEDASGIDLASPNLRWGARRTGEALRLIQGRYFDTPLRIRRLRDTFKGNADRIVQDLNKDIATAEQMAVLNDTAVADGEQS